jgi:hypothetical protein
MKKSVLTLSALLMSLAAVFAQQTDTTRTQGSDQYRKTEGTQSEQTQQPQPSTQYRDTTGLPSDTTNLEGAPESDTTGVSGTTPMQYDTGTYQINRRRKSSEPKRQDE